MDLRLYDIVKLTRPVEGLRLGAQGTIVDEFDGCLTVEFLGRDGETVALVDIPVADGQRVERPSVPA